MNEQEQTVLADVRAAMKQWHVRLDLVRTFHGTTGVQVEAKPGDRSAARWAKVGPLIFPPADGTLADTFAILAAMRDE